MTYQPDRGISAHYGRSTRRYRRLRDDFKARCAADHATCWICNQDIDYDADPTTGAPDAFNLDHYYPRSEHPELAEDPANFRPSHAGCNKARQAKQASGIGLGAPSRQW